jgi:Papain-like cysteine protease AvrRpt2
VAGSIRPNRTEVSRSFSYCGFTVRTGSAPAWFEVAIATDPALFARDARSRRTSQTFYSTRASGPLPAPTGEAVWIVPQAVLARFVGQPRLYYALATFRSPDRQNPELTQLTSAAAPAVTISRSYTGTTRRLAGIGGRGPAPAPAQGYGSGAEDVSLEWAGDAPATGRIESLPLSPAPTAQAAGLAAPFVYDDGLGELPPPRARPVDAIDIRYAGVQLLPQPQGWTCWAAAAAMVVGWREGLKIDPAAIDSGAPPWDRFDRTALHSYDGQAFAAAWRLALDRPAEPTVAGLAGLLERVGPVWVGRLPASDAPDSGHAVCITGVTGDGEPGTTLVHFHDPWPLGTGQADRALTYAQFTAEFDDFATNDAGGRVNTQIMHAGTRRAGTAQTLQVASAIRDAVIERIVNNEGDLKFELDQMHGMKYPNDNRANAGGRRQQRTFTIEGPRYRAFYVDDIFADLRVDFNYDGRAVGDVTIRRDRASDAVGKGLLVRASVMDDQRVFTAAGANQPFAAVRIALEYVFEQMVADNILVHADVMLYGNGAIDVHYRVVQGEVDQIPNPVDAGVTAQGEVRSLAVVEIASAIVGAVMSRILDNEGDVHWELDQMRGMKAPGDVAGQGPREVRDHSFTIPGPHAATVGGLDEIYADFRVDYQTDGRSVGNIQVTPVHTNDAVGAGLTVKENIMDDGKTYRGTDGYQPIAGVKIRFQHRFDNVVWGDLMAIADAEVFGDGDYRFHTEWTQ